jgi:histidinol dehydrogenase
MKIERIEWDGRDAPALAARVRSLAPPLSEVGETVAEIVAAVRERGDDAVRELSAEHDGVAPAQLRLGREEIAAAGASGAEPEVRDALDLAAANIRAVAEPQVSGEANVVQLPAGNTVTVREVALRSAGAYAPGGRAAYPSTVLMCAIPARVAGVKRVAIASPPAGDGKPEPLTAAACEIAGVDELFPIGGAQAIAAIAVGTESIEPVDLIVGPGNRFVQEAKRQLVGEVGIDGIEGPSELMVIAGETANLEWLSLDLCAQAEHGEDGLLVAAAVESRIVDGLADRVAELAAGRPSVGDPPLALIAVPDTDSAVGLANELAPEHLQLACADAEILAAQVETAGCVFVGETAATAFGDYVAGSNHVLPTGGAGRFQGPLGPGTFRRRISVVSLPAGSAAALAPHVSALAGAEGLPVHAESAAARVDTGEESPT